MRVAVTGANGFVGRHLLARLIWPAPRSAPLVCQWSSFRRAHQYWAGYYHRRRREKAA